MLAPLAAAPVDATLPSAKTAIRRPDFALNDILRPNVRALTPYRCARDDFAAGLLLDANENTRGPAVPVLAQVAGPCGPVDLHDPVDGSVYGADPQHARGAPQCPLLARGDLHRYPCPHQLAVKARWAAWRGVPGADRVFLGVGSDECIDMLVRVLCVPGKDAVCITPPTYGMYLVTAQMNDIAVVRAPLLMQGDPVVDADPSMEFQLNMELLKSTLASTPSIKILFLCSPGNPTGTQLKPEHVREILDYRLYKGLVVVDEAYIDYSEHASLASWTSMYPNLAVMQTLSKSFGLAGIRIGALLAAPPLIATLTAFKAPYNISTPSASLALAALAPEGIAHMRAQVADTLAERDRLRARLSDLSSPITKYIRRIAGGNVNANFLLVQIRNTAKKTTTLTADQLDNRFAKAVYQTMAENEGVVVRFRGFEPGCNACLRITIGTREENNLLLGKLEKVLRELEDAYL